MVVLRTRHATLQYRTNEPSSHIDHQRQRHMAAFYRKIEGPQPRRDVERKEDDPGATYRFDLTSADKDNLTDILHSAPPSEHFADWLLSLLSEH